MFFNCVKHAHVCTIIYIEYNNFKPTRVNRLFITNNDDDDNNALGTVFTFIMSDNNVV